MQTAACHLLIGTDLAKLMGHFVTGFRGFRQRNRLGTFLASDRDRLEWTPVVKKLNNTGRACSCLFAIFVLSNFPPHVSSPGHIGFPVQLQWYSTSLNYLCLSPFPCLTSSWHRRCRFSVSVPVLDPSLFCSTQICCISRAWITGEFIALLKYIWMDYYFF